MKAYLGATEGLPVTTNYVLPVDTEFGSGGTVQKSDATYNPASSGGSDISMPMPTEAAVPGSEIIESKETITTGGGSKTNMLLIGGGLLLAYFLFFRKKK